jgi:hypothetical protein
VTLKSSLGLLLANAWPGVEFTQDRPLSLVDVDLLLLDNVFLGVLFTQLESNFLLQGLYLLLKLGNPCHVLTSEHNFLHKHDWLRILREVKSRDAVWKVEVKSQRCVLSLVVLHNALKDNDVEWNVLSTNRQKNRVSLVVNVD